MQGLEQISKELEKIYIRVLALQEQNRMLKRYLREERDMREQEMINYTKDVTMWTVRCYLAEAEVRHLKSQQEGRDEPASTEGTCTTTQIVDQRME